MFGWNLAIYLGFIAGGTGKRTTLATVMIAAFIWMLAIICAIPALIGSNVKVNTFDNKINKMIITKKLNIHLNILFSTAFTN